MPSRPDTNHSDDTSPGALTTVGTERLVVDIDYTRLQEITRHVQLGDITLIGFNFMSQADPRRVRELAEAMPEYELHVIDARWFRQDTHFEVTLGYELVASLPAPGETQEAPLFRLRCGWLITYSLPADFKRPENHEEAAADFVFANGQINVFPFLRQLVLDTTAKGSWPPLMLPVFKIPRNRPAKLVRNVAAFPEVSSSEEGEKATAT